ncbi:transglutaminase superfamily protein [Palleronia aestuarii]|uniref:Transglutaminase superfamily protein n=1 Tax=Palleronia aestuarii TaxID=568105 RepID=A0A2W7N311_9RHOB|nr:transglutaminase-like domain-containing protein [Palleronia aestuarii]PZX14470.1 transglutaminase superfamily protein [Palleronia aestuarii]
MKLGRRDILMGGGAAALFTALPGTGRAGFAPSPSGWRDFEITTRVELPRGGASAQSWVPIPAVAEPGWHEAGRTRWQTNADRAEIAEDPATGARFVHAVWSGGSDDAVLEVVSVASTRDRDVDLVHPRDVAPLSEEDRARYLAPTMLIPTDGIVRETALGITQGAETDLDRARLIYDWIVESTERNPDTRGCGLGDIASMLAMGDLTGKCADLNTLFVGLARAFGLPARDIYGLRVAPSAFGYKSLGAGSPDVTKAQHCRAEVFLDDFGWVPVDPADVRKVVLEEPPKTLTLADPEVRDVRQALFGAWEGNWIGYNFAHDVELPGSDAGPVPFLMYPQAEIEGRPRDPLEPAAFTYSITARERAV